MQLKRIYDKTDPENPKVTGVKVLRAGALQRFSPDLIASAVEQGWMTLGAGKMVLTGENETIVYRILRTPGVYCSHCGFKADDSASAKVHVAALHADDLSPDPENPSGYAVIHFYEGVRE